MEWTEPGARVFACATGLSLLATVAVALRFVVRGHILHVLGPTDWFLLLNLAFTYANTACVGIHVSRGLGRAGPTLSLEETRSSIQITYIVIIIGNLSIILTKISILLLFLNIFTVTTGALRKVTYAVLVVVVAYGIALTLTNIFNCTPIGSMGDFMTGDPQSRCFDLQAKWYADAGLNIALDFVIFSLPIPVLRSMTLSWKSKIWLYGVFMLGFFVCVVSVIRLYFLHMTIVSVDPTYSSIYVAYWSTIEMNVALVIACVPTLKPLVMKWWPGVLDSVGSNRKKKRDGGNRETTTSGGDGGTSGQSMYMYPPTISSPRVPVKPGHEDQDMED